MLYSVRVHWSKVEDWSSSVEASDPGSALNKACSKIAQKAGVSEAFLRENAHFTVHTRPDP